MEFDTCMLVKGINDITIYIRCKHWFPCNYCLVFLANIVLFSWQILSCFHFCFGGIIRCWFSDNDEVNKYNICVIISVSQQLCVIDTTVLNESASSKQIQCHFSSTFHLVNTFYLNKYLVPFVISGELLK